MKKKIVFQTVHGKMTVGNSFSFIADSLLKSHCFTSPCTISPVMNSLFLVDNYNGLEFLQWSLVILYFSHNVNTFTVLNTYI